MRFEFGSLLFSHAKHAVDTARFEKDNDSFPRRFIIKINMHNAYNMIAQTTNVIII